MQKEIHEQPDAIIATMRGRINTQGKEVRLHVGARLPLCVRVGGAGAARGAWRVMRAFAMAPTLSSMPTPPPLLPTTHHTVPHHTTPHHTRRAWTA
jgi:hypothetical protein